MVSIFSKWHLFAEEEEIPEEPCKTFYYDDQLQGIIKDYECVHNIAYKFTGSGHVVAKVNFVLTEKQFQDLMLNRKPIE